MNKKSIIFCDFDGTVFDPDVRLLWSPMYNQQSSRLISANKSVLVITTGRHSWDWPSRLHYGITGMKQPDVVVCGAGSIIHWKTNQGYALDNEWDMKMKDGWDKDRVHKKLSEYLELHHLGEQPVPNPYMLVARLYSKSIPDVAEIQTDLQKFLANEQVKVILSEQLFMPNNAHVFNGYALIVPAGAGKEQSAQYVISKLQKDRSETLDVLAFGDAAVDIPMLGMKAPAGVQRYEAYGMHLTTLARQRANGTHIILLEGSSPKNIYTVLSKHFKSHRNSPYRALLAPFEALIDKTVHPNLTPNELTKQGLDDVRKGLQESGMRGFVRVFIGHLMDAADGIRARRHPELKEENGQLVDVYADRMKEFEELVRRGRYEAALTCVLPSIARAQAEALGLTVPELDRAGGSALTRTRRLLTSLFFWTLGMHDQSKKIDEHIAAANLHTFHRRRTTAQNFSWSPNHLKTYNKTAMERLLLLVEILQEQNEAVSKHKSSPLPEHKEYLALKPAQIRTLLKLPTHSILH